MAVFSTGIRFFLIGLPRYLTTDQASPPSQSLVKEIFLFLFVA